MALGGATDGRHRRRAFPFPCALEIGLKGEREAKVTAMQKVNLTDKKCATCRWWQGERGIQFWNKKPFKVECDAKGDCMAIKAPKTFSVSCPRWVAWEKLP